MTAPTTEHRRSGPGIGRGHRGRTQHVPAASYPDHAAGSGPCELLRLGGRARLRVGGPGHARTDSHAALVTRLAQLGATPTASTPWSSPTPTPTTSAERAAFDITSDAEVVAHTSFRTIFDPLDDDTAELLDSRIPVVNPVGSIRHASRDLFGDSEIPDLPARHTP